MERWIESCRLIGHDEGVSCNTLAACVLDGLPESRVVACWGYHSTGICFRGSQEEWIIQINGLGWVRGEALFQNIRQDALGKFWKWKKGL